MADTILEGCDICKTFRRGEDVVHALRGVSFCLKAGNSLGIVGESGAGKSTLLNCMLALEQPDSGSILFHEEKLNLRNKVQLKRFRSEVQVVFQDPKSSLDPRMNIEDIIAEPLDALHVRGNRRERVCQLLEAVGLPQESIKKYPHEFSGGQRQRIAIARALAPQPRVVIADEPVSALDVSVRHQILELFKSLKRTMALSLVLVSHDLAIVAQLCEQSIVLQHGLCVESGLTEQLFLAPEHEYTRELIAAIPNR
ncbi:MAG: ATP-binding cassette domain-containing protein [Treponema sp.]|nr:ATP-binding cassette domain-containing protein [Treponema sp.]